MKASAKRGGGRAEAPASAAAAASPLAGGQAHARAHSCLAGVTYPSVQQLVGAHVPRDKRSRALSLIYSGHQLGTIGSFLIAPYIIRCSLGNSGRRRRLRAAAATTARDARPRRGLRRGQAAVPVTALWSPPEINMPRPLRSHLGWEAVFLAFGSLGLFWLLAWARLPSPPASDGAAAATGADESSAALSPSSLRLRDVPWAAFAASPACWAIVSAQVSVTIGNTLAFSWLPTFYHEASVAALCLGVCAC